MEMKFYELIGIRQWKKFVLWLMAQIIRNPRDRRGTNYYLKDLSLEAVKDFKKQLLFNGSVHLIGMIACMFGMIVYYVQGELLLSKFLYLSILFILNLYCVMLQRYNWLRIKKVLARVARK